MIGATILMIAGAGLCMFGATGLLLADRKLRSVTRWGPDQRRRGSWLAIGLIAFGTVFHWGGLDLARRAGATAEPAIICQPCGLLPRPEMRAEK